MFPRMNRQAPFSCRVEARHHTRITMWLQQGIGSSDKLALMETLPDFGGSATDYLGGSYHGTGKRMP